ncbi:glucose import [Tritrichomonas musculus]|uniref:Glucose import n=1 Tax=Tritrichomonas musculus TaxID=1915356 RepID=A0ABR2IP60_9EUKA
MVFCSKHLLYALVICLGPITFGNICVYPSPTGTEIRKLHNLPDDSMAWAFYNGVTSLTAILGPFFNELLFRIFHNSRKKTAFTISVLCVISWFSILLTKFSIWAGIACRTIMGVLLGSISSLSPMYLVEIAPKGFTGLYGSFNQLSIAISYSLLNFLGPYLNYIELCYYSAVFPFLEALLIWFVPETSKEARELKIGKTEQIQHIQTHPKEKLFQKKNAQGLIIGLALNFIQQWSGISAFITNMTDMMKNSGLNLSPSNQAGIVQLSQCIACIISCFFIDKIGRRLAWTCSCLGASFFLFLNAINGVYGWSSVIPILSLFMFQFSYGIGIGTIPWFIIPEYFDYAIRSEATGFCIAFNWLMSFGVIFIWPIMNSNIGQNNSFFVFMGICILGVFFGLFGLKEPLSQEVESTLLATLPISSDETTNL